MDCDRFRGEEFFHVIAILSELIVAVGEDECRWFDNEVECRGPLATRFNLRRGFWSSKLDFSRSNTSDAFVNAMDVVERTEDSIDVEVSPLMSASHSVLGKPAGALKAHLIHLLTAARSLWKILRVSLVLMQLGFAIDFLSCFSLLNQGIWDLYNLCFLLERP